MPLPDRAPLHSIVLEMIQLVAEICVRSGALKTKKAARDVSDLFARSLIQLVSQVMMRGSEEPYRGNPYVPAEVLSRWALLKQYVGADGKPRPLRAKGRGLTFASLVRLIDPHENPARVLDYLLKIGNVARVGKLFVPTSRIAQHPISGPLLRVLEVRAVAALLRSIMSNAREGRPRQYQFTTDGSIPESELDEFQAEVRGVFVQALLTVDELILRRRNNPARQGDPLVPLTMGLYMNAEGSHPASPVEASPNATSVSRVRHRRRGG
jgi:hypothetical protein